VPAMCPRMRTRRRWCALGAPRLGQPLPRIRRRTEAASTGGPYRSELKSIDGTLDPRLPRAPGQITSENMEMADDVPEPVTR
jgi:hypothetical protein